MSRPADNQAMSILVTHEAAAPVARLSPEVVAGRLHECARLPSLSSINEVLRELLQAEQRYITQICDVLRRDPGVTTRLLRLVNAVYYGLSTPVASIEEAVFFLGMRQLRQLVMTTPVIEELQKMTGHVIFAWRDFWQHCIGTAILTNEILGKLQPSNDETGYIAGLLHDVGKIVMAVEFPDHFALIHSRAQASPQDILELETSVLGMNHCEMGALYLQNHRLPDLMVQCALYHHQAPPSGPLVPMVAAVQLADLLMLQSGVGQSAEPAEATTAAWQETQAWRTLFPDCLEAEKKVIRTNLLRSLERLPSILEGLV